MKSRGADSLFTRHLLRIGLQCPAKLYFKAHGYAEDQSIRPFLEHAGFNKYYLKKLASLQYQQSKRVASSNRRQAAEQTANYLSASEITLLEASFLADNCYAKVPILEKEGASVTLMDIQTKVFHPDKHRLTDHHGSLYQKWKPYIVDLAYKKFVIQQQYPAWEIKTKLLLPDKTYRAENDKLLMHLKNGHANLRSEDLFCDLDVSLFVDEILTKNALDDKFENVLNHFKELYFEGSWHQSEIGRKCGNCEFRLPDSQKASGDESGFDRCWSGSEKVPGFSPGQPPVLDLIGPGINEWVVDDVYLQKNIKLNELPPLEEVLKDGRTISQKHRQTLHVRQTKGKEIPAEIVKQPIFDEIERWEYPLHFLDFEAGNYAVPVRKNRKPYHLVVFQFSCHTLHTDGRCVHHQWVDTEGKAYPNYELVRQLKKVPNIEKGTIVQYSKFEHYALKTIRKELRSEENLIEDATSLIDWLNNIVERHDSDQHHPPYLADMSRLVKNYYFNRYMENSLSIKDVLQSVLTLSDTLEQRYTKPYNSANFSDMIWWQWNDEQQQAESPYNLLRRQQRGDGVGRGTEAMVLYGKFLAGELRESVKEQAMQSLLGYCELDTLAMVMIYEHWQNLASTTRKPSL